MKLGVFGINSGTTFGPAATSRLAARCEALGYESWWAGEHVVVPSPRVPPSPMRPTDPILDPLVHLAFVAGVSERMLLGTGIIIVPQRNPLVLAKQIASLDNLCAGRFVFGIGVGYLQPEMDAIGVPMSERASRTDDHLAAMRAIWYQDGPVAFHGPHTSFSGVDAHPRPTHTIPIVVGGRTRGAHRRAVQQGDGWYGFFLSPDDTAEQVRQLAEAATLCARPAELGRLEISVTPAGPLTADAVQAYADAGVDRLIVYPVGLDEAATDRYLAEHAELVLG
ncbi:MAG: TIGR03619 family F420-dependent LLM class oxidoreductase [Actinobacteria bacterium]|nr:TIGR03619 family F420-dependent LLM class oxidoreductase [Actinomycetota bacterium]